MKYCNKCGAKVSQDAKFCTNCGEKFSRNQNIEKHSSKRYFSKKTWIIGAIALIIVVFGCFWFYNRNNNPKGVWMGETGSTVLSIENKGTGYFYQDGCVRDHQEYSIAAPITWKKKRSGKFQIKYNNSTFNAHLKNGKLITDNGVHWNAEDYDKTNKSVDQARSEINARMNLSINDIINSNKKNVWLEVESAHGSFINSDVLVGKIYITQNGKSNCYDLKEFVKLDELNKMTSNDIEKYAKSNSNKSFNTTVKPQIWQDPYIIRGRLNDQAFTGFASGYRSGALLLRVNVNKNQNIPVFRLND